MSHHLPVSVAAGKAAPAAIITAGIVLLSAVVSEPAGLLLAQIPTPTPAAIVFVPAANGPRASGAIPTATPTPPAVPTATPIAPAPTPTTPAGTTNWLSYVNLIRSLANLPPVTEVAEWSAQAVQHAQYMVKNQVVGHTENPALPFYSVGGDLAARNGNVAANSDVDATDQTLINSWVTGPFHQIGIIDPRLTQTGYGAYREAGRPFQSAATLDVLRGLAGSVPAGISFPVIWPADGKTIGLASYQGNESPDPLTACAGYAAPTGLPLYLQLGPGAVTPNITASSFKQGATELEHCRYSGATYVNPDPGEQTLARSILSDRSAIVIIPRAPLTPGSSYTVSLTNSGTTYTWTFSVAATATGSRSAER